MGKAPASKLLASGHHVNYVHEVNKQSVPGAQVVSRAARLLKLFLQSPGLTAAQAAERLKINRTTAFRILSALEVEGLLSRDAQGIFGLGPQIARLGQLAQGEPRTISERGREILQRVAEAVLESVSLETLDGGDALVVADAVHQRILVAESYVGRRWPSHTTATGKVLLAPMTKVRRTRLLAGHLEAVTEHTITSRRRFEAELVEVLRQGYALNLEELELGYVAIAVPVVDPFGVTVAALSLGGPKSRLPVKVLRQHLPLLRAAAEELGEILSRGGEG
ncbi:MAG: hypothetical protein RL398_1894 [Planctomycetota bacterium]|jgi:DNA-binding IclR family transcriptional regulator